MADASTKPRMPFHSGDRESPNEPDVPTPERSTCGGNRRTADPADRVSLPVMRNVAFPGRLVVLAAAAWVTWAAAPGAGPPPRLDQGLPQGLFAIDGHRHRLFRSDRTVSRLDEVRAMAAAGVGGAVVNLPLDPSSVDDVVAHVVRDRESITRQAAAAGVPVALVEVFDAPGGRARTAPFQVALALEYFGGVFGGSLENIRRLRASGIVSIVLADHQRDGLAIARNGRRQLTDHGRRVVGELNAHGMAIDISHLDEALQLEVIECSRAPVWASHSNTRALANVPRNLSEAVLAALARTGGFVQLTFDHEFLFGTGTAGRDSGATKLVDHLDHMVRRHGLERIGLGSDFIQGSEGKAVGLRDARAFGAIHRELVRRGYDASRIVGIMSGHLIDFFARVRAGSHAAGAGQPRPAPAAAGATRAVQPLVAISLGAPGAHR